jgi:hypothetical protein
MTEYQITITALVGLLSTSTQEEIIPYEDISVTVDDLSDWNARERDKALSRACLTARQAFLNLHPDIEKLMNSPVKDDYLVDVMSAGFTCTQV